MPICRDIDTSANTFCCHRHPIRLIGFEELGNTDNFSTTMLELRYKTVGVIEDDKKDDKRNLKKKSIFGRDYGSDEGTDDEY